MNDFTAIERQSMEVDIACVGFGPATGGFLTTLSRAILGSDGQPALESRVMPGMPPQVVCYERSDDLGFGVSGVVTKARAIRESFPDADLAQIPMSHSVDHESIAYLQDPVGASRRPRSLSGIDKVLRAFGSPKNSAIELPYVPEFLRKDGGLLLSLGQFNQWVAGQLMATGAVQLWPGTPVAEALIEGERVEGIRLVDQGTDPEGNPSDGYMPGMDIRAGLTVVGDGPVGAVGSSLDRHFGLPDGNHQHDWAVGMKMVVDLPENCELQPGTVVHTVGFPEPEIFGFLYVYPDRIASLGIFVPSWLQSPVRNSYRYLQHWMQHPYLWRHLEGGTMRSWGAKSLQESGRRGEPHLVGDGWARIGEGSGSTNVLAGSGVDEAWATGVQLAEGVIELWREGKPLDREHLERAYVDRRRKSWVERDAKVAEKARDGFRKDFVTGILGMGLTGLTKGKLNLSPEEKSAQERMPTLSAYYDGRIPSAELESIGAECRAAGTSLHDALMERVGWPKIPFDGKLLVSHQDALLMGGKVQAPPGYADHIVFAFPDICLQCESKLCIEICSGAALTPSAVNGSPEFDREKCVHCGACVWSCPQGDGEYGNIQLKAGAGGLHSAEN